MPKQTIFLTLVVACLTLFASNEVTISFISGNVTVLRANTTKFEPAKLNTKLFSDDIIKTEKNSKAIVKFADGSSFIVPAEKTMKVSEIEKIKLHASKQNLNELLKSVSQKIAKDTDKPKSGVTAVAGVRGDDVDAQKPKTKPSELKWKIEKETK